MTQKIQHLEKVSHDYIRYANVWEDADLLVEKLGIREDDKVLSIASAGDNALACLVKNPSIVVAVDLNKPQLYLTELRREAIRHLTREECLVFLGFEASESRQEMYDRVSRTLTPDCKAYWDANIEVILVGLIHQGKFEKYLSLFAKKLLPWIHKKETILALFAEKSQAEQQEFYEQKWNTWKWRALFKIFFSKTVMGRLGRDPAFLKQVEGSVGTLIYQKAGRHLSSTGAQRNQILRYCLTGSFGGILPLYLRRENYQIIKDNIDNLHLVEGYVQDVEAKYGKFDRFNLSNIFEYMCDDVFASTTRSLVDMGNSGATYGYWNLLVPRVMSDRSKNLDSKFRNGEREEYDAGFFYKEFILDQKR